jgi:hypothetical protein
MRHLLEILTRADDPVARAVVEEAMKLPDCRVEVVDLVEAGANYEALLERIFEADSAHVW